MTEWNGDFGAEICMITTITLENFKSHKYTVLELDDSRLHATVGHNSSGKTSILPAVHYLSQLANRPFSAIFQYDRSPEYLATSGQSNVNVSMSGFWGYRNRQSWAVAFAWENRGDGKWSPSCTWILDSNKVGRNGWSSSLQEAPNPVPQAVDQTVYLKLVARNLAHAAYSDEVVPRVEYDGSGLTPALDYLQDFWSFYLVYGNQTLCFLMISNRDCIPTHSVNLLAS